MEIKKFIIKATLAISLFTMIFFTNGLSVKAAGNYQDTQFYHYYNGDGGDRFTPLRSKLDYTSSYSNNNHSVYGYTANIYGGSNYTYCTYGTPRHLAVGQAKYLPNLVKERGYNSAGLGLMSDSHNPSLMNMLWSPDSI